MVVDQAASIERANAIPTPEQFFGFPMGADRKLARWDKMVEYYGLLARSSNRVKLENMGPSTEGNPFIVLFISSRENLARLEQYRRINAKLSDPRGIGQEEIEQLVGEGKAVIVQSMGLHAGEVAASQMAPELVHDLLSRDDDQTLRILNNVITILIPCFNPDGQIMLTDWYRKYLGTPYEGGLQPGLYHKYAGHDNNRDAFQLNLVESKYAARILFREWVPQAYVDHHQMGAYGPRMYVPPYAEPIRPSADPLVWREMSWYGSHVAYKEEEIGKSGVVSASIYAGWGHLGFHWITPFHNIAGMLTESASARIATPLFLHLDQLKGHARSLPEYEPQTTFPNPWPGGWWRPREIVEMQKIAAWAVLDMAARNRETVLRNAHLKAKRQTERGANGRPTAFVIPLAQHDPQTAIRMINTLVEQGIEVHRALRSFIVDSRTYDAGSFVVSMAQPKMGVVRWLLGQTFYPDNVYTRDREGNPIQPYDMCTDTMTEFMGVRSDPADMLLSPEFVKLTTPVMLEGTLSDARVPAHVLDGSLNDSFRVVNLLMAKDVSVRRVAKGVDSSASPSLKNGDFVVLNGVDPSGVVALTIAEVAKMTGVSFKALKNSFTQHTYALRKLRVGMYQRYYGGNVDEGWTRFVLEMFAFEYASLADSEIKAGGLDAKYDVIILPSDTVQMMTGARDGVGTAGGPEGSMPRSGTDIFPNRDESTPPDYRSGFGDDGVKALLAFVERGGTLLTFGQAGDLPIQYFGLPLRNVVSGRSAKEFWSPGSTLRVRFANHHPLVYGMPTEGLAVFVTGSQVYEIAPRDRNEDVQVLATYADRGVLQSGCLIGESFIAKKAAAVSVKKGAGRVVLIGFRPQHRSQAHGTFKLVFNVLLSPPTTPPNGAEAH